MKNSTGQMVWDDIFTLYIMNELLMHCSLIYTIYIGMDVQTDDEPLAGVSVSRWKKTCCQQDGVNLIYRSNIEQSLLLSGYNLISFLLTIKNHEFKIWFKQRQREKYNFFMKDIKSIRLNVPCYFYVLAWKGTHLINSKAVYAERKPQSWRKLCTGKCVKTRARYWQGPA